MSNIFWYMQAWQAANISAAQPSSGSPLPRLDASGISTPAEFGSDVDFIFPSFQADESLASLAYANTDPAALPNGR